MKHYLTGLVIDGLSNHLLSYLGKELAQLHTINAPKFLANSLSYGIETFKQVHEYATGSSFGTWLGNITSIIKPQLCLDLPRSLIHGDLFSNNVVISHDKKSATIMDLEEACYYYRIYDIGMSIVGLCSNKDKVDLAKVQCFLEGYQQENTLSNLESNSLKTFTIYAATSIAFWRHKHFNYIEPQKSMFNHYLVMKNLADHVIGLPQDCFQLNRNDNS